MSEVTPEELIEEISFTVDDSDVVPMPIDPTLSHEGEAADAAATGAAIAGVINNLRINEKAPVNNAITLFASDIPVSSDEGAPSIAERLEDISDRGADDISYDATNQITVKGALDDIYTTLDSELSEEDIDNIFDEVFGGDE